jgi:SAM-dependent methyltransferase
MQKFDPDEYVATMKKLCGDPRDCKFPTGYMGNVRGWDYKKIVEGGEFKPTDIVFECGAFHSYFCIYLSQYVKEYYATDSFYWAHREYCNSLTHQSPEEWCKYIEEKGRGKIVAGEADIQQLRFPDNTFDKIISISVMEHIIDDHGALKEMMRVLKPGGLLLMTMEYHPTQRKEYSEVDGSFHRVYDRNDKEKLLAGLNIEDEEVCPTPMRPQDRFTAIYVKMRK